MYVFVLDVKKINTQGIDFILSNFIRFSSFSKLVIENSKQIIRIFNPNEN